MPGRSGDHYEAEISGYTTWDMPDDTLWYEVEQDHTVRDHVNPADVEGLWIHTWNTDGKDEHWFWVRSYMPLTDWETWDDLIANVSDMHNMSFA